MENGKICGCGQQSCGPVRTPVQTQNGEVFVLAKTFKDQDQQHMQKKIDNAAKIEIDGNGKVVNYEHAMADKAEESYRKIIAKPKRRSLWSWLKSLFNRKS